MLLFSPRVRGARLAFTSAVVIALVALSTACAPGAQRSVSIRVAPLTITSTPRASNALHIEARNPRHMISRPEFSRIPAVANAHDLIARLRPEFLRGTYRRVAFGSATEPVVYVDALKAGHLSTLQLIPIDQVHDITYVTPVDAMVRFGPTHGAGAIIVRTRQ